MENSIKFPLLNVHDEVLELETFGKQEVEVIKRGGWRSSMFIIGVEVVERFVSFGISKNLITYLTNELGESTATAAKNINIYSGATYLLPLLGAFIADSYWGRFNTILISCIIYIMGLVMLTLSVSVVPLGYQHILFFLSLYMVAVGAGGAKPCLLSFGANQFDENRLDEKKAKSSYFNWRYASTRSGCMMGMLILIYIQDNLGWTVGFGIPAILMTFALVLFLLGAQSYRQEAPNGSPLVRIMQVFVAAYCKRHLCVSKLNGYCSEDGSAWKPARTLACTDQFKCLDKATIIEEIDGLSNNKCNWRLCSVTQVEEVKLLIGLVPIWLSCLMYTVVQAQIETFFTMQGSSMERLIGHNFHIPPASLQVTITLVIILTVPLYVRILVPTLRHWTGCSTGITTLQRIGIGMFFSIVAMAVAALVEARRVKIAIKYGLIDLPEITVPMSIWWLLPQYVIHGVADVFTVIGMQEFFYDQMPDGMQSIGSAIYFCVFGGGSLLSSVVISIVQSLSSSAGDKWLGENLNRAHLDYYYWLLAGLCTLWLGVYVGVSKHYLYKKIDGEALI